MATQTPTPSISSNPMTGATAESEAVTQRCSLKDYLENTWLPGFQRAGSRRALQETLRAQPWPKYPELQRNPGTRSLVEVQQLNQWNYISLQHTQQCKSRYLPDGRYTYLYSTTDMARFSHTFIENESLVEEEDSVRLRLPSRGLVNYEDSDLEFLSDIKNEDDFVSLIQEYILGTVSEAIRLVEGISADHFHNKQLKFIPSSYLCPAHHARWDILSLVSHCAAHFFARYSSPAST